MNQTREGLMKNGKSFFYVIKQPGVVIKLKEIRKYVLEPKQTKVFWGLNVDSSTISVYLS